MITAQEAQALTDSITGNDSRIRELIDTIDKGIKKVAKDGEYQFSIEVPRIISSRVTTRLRLAKYEVYGVADIDNVTLNISWGHKC